MVVTRHPPKGVKLFMLLTLSFDIYQRSTFAAWKQPVGLLNMLANRNRMKEFQLFTCHDCRRSHSYKILTISARCECLSITSWANIFLNSDPYIIVNGFCYIGRHIFKLDSWIFSSAVVHVNICTILYIFP